MYQVTLLFKNTGKEFFHKLKHFICSSACKFAHLDVVLL